MGIREEIESYIVRSGMTMTEVVDKLYDDYDWSRSVPNLSGKLRRGSLRYQEAVELADVLDYYTTTRGEFTVVCVDGKPVGIGKLTVLYDNSAWLELLRVHPQYQRQGAGTALYRSPSANRPWL